MKDERLQSAATVATGCVIQEEAASALVLLAHILLTGIPRFDLPSA
jgi:hypothetical protein